MADFNPPTSTLFSFQALGSGTGLSISFDASKGYSIVRTDTGVTGADLGAFQGKAVPAGGSWTAKMKFKPFTAGAANDRHRIGLAVYESATGKIMWVGFNYSEGTRIISAIHTTSLNSFGTTDLAVSYVGRTPDYVAITWNGTSYLMKMSFDGGITYVTLATVAATTAFTTAADKIGIYINGFTNSAPFHFQPGALIDYYNDPDF